VFVVVDLAIALAALNLHSGGSLSIPSGFELRDQSRLLRLSEDARGLAHSDFERVARLGENVAGADEDPNAALDQRDDAGLLNDQLARKSRSILDTTELRTAPPNQGIAARVKNSDDVDRIIHLTKYQNVGEAT